MEMYVLFQHIKAILPVGTNVGDTIYFHDKDHLALTEANILNPQKRFALTGELWGAYCEYHVKPPF